jgi:hypothetical protein
MPASGTVAQHSTVGRRRETAGQSAGGRLRRRSYLDPEPGHPRDVSELNVTGAPRGRAAMGLPAAGDLDSRTISPMSAARATRPIMLVVEDESEVRARIRGELERQYGSDWRLGGGTSHRLIDPSNRCAHANAGSGGLRPGLAACSGLGLLRRGGGPQRTGRRGIDAFVPVVPADAIAR